MVKKVFVPLLVALLCVVSVGNAQPFKDEQAIYQLELPARWRVVQSSATLAVFSDKDNQNVFSISLYPSYPAARSQDSNYMILRLINEKLAEKVPGAVIKTVNAGKVANQEAVLTSLESKNKAGKKTAEFLAMSFWVNDKVIQILCRSNQAENADALLSVFKPIIDSVRLQSATAYEWAVKGRKARDTNQFETALDAYAQAAALDANNTEYIYQLAYTYSHTGDYERAIAEITKAIALRPKTAFYYHERAYAHVQMKNPQAALADAEQAITLNPRISIFYAGRGNAHAMTGNYEAALADFQKCAELKGGILDADFNLAQVYELLGRREEAIRCYQTVAASPALPEPVKVKVEARINGDWGTYKEWI